jgi:hypothetical protein
LLVGRPPDYSGKFCRQIDQSTHLEIAQPIR